MTEIKYEDNKQKITAKENREKKTSNQGDETYSFIKNAVIGEIEININHTKQKNPVNVLKELYKIHAKDSLPIEEKNRRAREVIKSYMG